MIMVGESWHVGLDGSVRAPVSLLLRHRPSALLLLHSRGHPHLTTSTTTLTTSATTQASHSLQPIADQYGEWLSCEIKLQKQNFKVLFKDFLETLVVTLRSATDTNLPLPCSIWAYLHKPGLKPTNPDTNLPLPSSIWTYLDKPGLKPTYPAHLFNTSRPIYLDQTHARIAQFLFCCLFCAFNSLFTTCYILFIHASQYAHAIKLVFQDIIYFELFLIYVSNMPMHSTCQCSR